MTSDPVPHWGNLIVKQCSTERSWCSTPPVGRRFTNCCGIAVNPYFTPSIALSLEGRDLRPLPLIQRKKKLERLVKSHARILYARHVESDGVAFFRLVCEQEARHPRRRLVQDPESRLFAVRSMLRATA